ncbi:hypothetical protein INS49_007816 [Diaporthe citri]|uniref:uncharacterized protein n=1 Tax=Diaporthe citri TaxID=83186 RepID=UPI001C809A07|nr:uncharacterized protein INS49_007816 [Diaporthe citri]KAG6362723.1 hypothetical protein INS49_007816 [Diaporthe citri]
MSIGRNMVFVGLTKPEPPPQPHVLTIRDRDLGRALGTLRATPAAELFAVRTLRIVLTEPNVLYWHGSLWPAARAVFDDEDEFRALLRFVAKNFDLAKLDWEVDARSAAWGLFEDKGAGAYGGEEVDEDWKFVYEWYLEVGRALADVLRGRKLQRLSVKTSIWNGMGPWLTGQSTGTEIVVDGSLPRYHDVGMRLLSGGDGIETD